jgi:uncharacterized membrane protein YhaH (DUF805 family)
MNQASSCFLAKKIIQVLSEIQNYMKKINVALVRLLQFVVFTLFTFMVITYFGAMVLLPLDAISLLIKLMSAIGLNGFIAAVIAIPVVGYLSLLVYKTPGLSKMIVDTGVDLVKAGKTRVEAFNEIASAIKG